ncbi:unnamed protein product [Mesocestoides corti]|uniref:Uncharacterized protein n=1 Tax=Mesocestoides corti TaxID=53468 RepID=A0A0R3U8T9_MESCO|nr:unnamed protein product [Mesocestoides corti]
MGGGAAAAVRKLVWLIVELFRGNVGDWFDFRLKDADKEQEELKEVAGEKEGDDGEEGGGEEQAANDDRAEEVEGEVVAAAAAEEAPGAEAAESAPQTGDSDPVADVDGAASNSNRHNRPSARRRDKSTKPSRPSLVVKRIPASVSSTANTTTSAIANRSRHSTANSRVPKKTVSM